MRDFVSIDDGKTGLLVANRGLREAEAYLNPEGNSEIALTLLRCVGWLSRDDFPARRGHAGPGLPTPGAQMIGRHSFEYAVVPWTGPGPASRQAILAYQQAYAFNAPLRALPAGLHPGSLPGEHSFLEVSPASFVLSTVKAAEDGRGWIVRGYNLTGQPVQVALRPAFSYRQAWRLNLAEQPQAALQPDAAGTLHIEARGYEIVTVRFE